MKKGNSFEWVNLISDEEKELFKSYTFIDNKVLNAKLNFIIDLFTQTEQGSFEPAEKGMEIQDNPELTADTQVGRMLIESTLKNAEMEEAMTSIGQGVVEIMLNQQLGGI